MSLRFFSQVVLCSLVMGSGFVSSASALTDQELVGQARIRRLFANSGHQIHRRRNFGQGHEGRQGSFPRRRQQRPG